MGGVLGGWCGWRACVGGVLARVVCLIGWRASVGGVGGVLACLRGWCG